MFIYFTTVLRYDENMFGTADESDNSRTTIPVRSYIESTYTYKEGFSFMGSNTRQLMIPLPDYMSAYAKSRLAANGVSYNGNDNGNDNAQDEDER